jgi:hypothetical protein
MLEYLAFRNMLWAFTKLPLWLFLGAIACLFYRSKPYTIEADPARWVVLQRQCLAQYPPIPRADLFDRVPPDERQKQRDHCSKITLAQAQKEYAQSKR